MNTIGLAPPLLQRLGRMRLLYGGVVGQTGPGDRPSRSSGEGFEFEDYSEYQAGDDLKRVDPNLFARLGQHYVRRFNVSQQLNVTLLLDVSRSMMLGTPTKVGLATALSRGLAMVGVAGSDSVQVGVIQNGTVEWMPRLSNVKRLSELDAWLSLRSGGGETNLAASVESARNRLRQDGLTIVISDFWCSSSLRAIDVLAASGQSVVALVVLAVEETDPTLIPKGSCRLVDIESNSGVSISVGPEEVAQYSSLLTEWLSNLRSKVLSRQGRFAEVTTAASLEQILLQDLPRVGVMR